MVCSLARIVSFLRFVRGDGIRVCHDQCVVRDVPRWPWHRYTIASAIDLRKTTIDIDTCICTHIATVLMMIMHDIYDDISFF